MGIEIEKKVRYTSDSEEFTASGTNLLDATPLLADMDLNSTSNDILGSIGSEKLSSFDPLYDNLRWCSLWFQT
eukprot:Ihof_evm2s22 gene=Ihof_evmTU2s22